jgi:hypothetical protein
MLLKLLAVLLCIGVALASSQDHPVLQAGTCYYDAASGRYAFKPVEDQSGALDTLNITNINCATYFRALIILPGFLWSPSFRRCFWIFCRYNRSFGVCLPLNRNKRQIRRCCPTWMRRIPRRFVAVFNLRLFFWLVSPPTQCPDLLDCLM